MRGAEVVEKDEVNVGLVVEKGVVTVVGAELVVVEVPIVVAVGIFKGVVVVETRVGKNKTRLLF